MSAEEVPIRVFVVDDHPLVRTGLGAIIRAETDLVFVGDAGDGEEAIHRIPAAEPDVVLMDLVMPKRDGIDTMVALRKLQPQLRFLMLTSLVDAGEIRRAMAAGATGYVLKNATAHELVNLIRATFAGRRSLSVEASDALSASEHSGSGVDLTQRERELLGFMVQGKSNQDIAVQLGISLPTVKFHVTNILSKLGAENRTEAVLKALKLKIVQQK